MAKSLQEQLLEAGAIKKDRAQKIKKTKHKQNKQKQRGSGEADDIKLAAEKSQAQKTAKDREINRHRQEAAITKALAAQIKQLIDVNRVDDGAGEEPYNFNFQSKIKTVYVTEEQRKALAGGRLAIVGSQSTFSVVPAAVAHKIMERDATSVISVMEPVQNNEQAEDDPYAEYVIPDELTW